MQKKESINMVKTLFYLGVLILGLFSCSSPVEPKTNATIDRQTTNFASFMPENDLDHEDGQFYGQTGISEQEFDEVLDGIEQIYTPIFESFGATLVVNRFYSDKTVNAYAEQAGSRWIVSFFGGLARRPEITKEGFALVACHEIGHHIAGYPFYKGEWASNEGNSDFYSTAACARMIFGDSSPCSFLPEQNEQAQANCALSYGEDNTICQRSLAGGLSLGKLLAALNNERVPSYSTPDKTIVKTTMDSHPKAQCRVDTYRLGAICTKEWNNSIMPKSSAEMRQNSCAERPKCWFKS
jgi:hypothetical protein